MFPNNSKYVAGWYSQSLNVSFVLFKELLKEGVLTAQFARLHLVEAAQTPEP